MNCPDKKSGLINPLFRYLNQTARQYDKYFSGGAGNGSIVNGIELPEINYDVIKRELTPILNCRWGNKK